MIDEAGSILTCILEECSQKFVDNNFYKFMSKSTIKKIQWAYSIDAAVYRNNKDGKFWDAKT